MKNRKISIILPIFKESLVLSDIKNISREFKKLRLDWEFICVLDDRLEKKSGKLKLLKLPHIEPLFYPLKRFGKGFAFCYGFNKSKGDLVFFWEGNFTISPKLLLLYINLLDLVEADVVYGSKRHPLSHIYYSYSRRLVSKIFQLLVRTLFGLNVTDTQVGLKLYKREVLNEVIPRIIIKNWAFDLEVLVVAHNLGFQRIIEAPIEIEKHYLGKTMSPVKAYNLLKDTLAIFYRKYVLKYYQQEFV